MGLAEGCRSGLLGTASERVTRQRDAMQRGAEPGCTRFFSFAIFLIFSLR
jgi:hypothetical protein